jgi:hypothetical protein
MQSAGVSATQELGSSSMRRRASILGTIYALMRRRFAALRYFIPLPVDGFLAAIVRSL